MKYLKPSRKWSVADMLINAEFCVIFRKSLEKNRIRFPGFDFGMVV